MSYTTDENTNTIAAQVIVVPGTPQAVVLEQGATVRNALVEADVDPSGLTVRLNGASATLDTPVPNGARIVLSRQIKGN